MLNVKLTEKNRSYIYEQIYEYDSELATNIKNSKDGFLVNVLSKEDFWNLCKICNDNGIRLW